MNKKPALGRGLGALLKDDIKSVKDIKDKGAEKIVRGMAEVELIHIEVNPFQPRSKFDEEGIQELSQSIKELGLIQPITVRKVDEDRYQLISGERRYRAARLAGLETLPAYVRIANDKESLEMALVENIQREELDAIEIALSYQRLIEECNITQEEMSTRVGKKRSTITNYLRLLKLDPLIQSGVRDRIISMGHARALINIDDSNSQLDIYENIVSKNLSVRQSEDLVRNFKEGKDILKSEGTNVRKNNKILSQKIENDIDILIEKLKSKVDIKMGKKGNGKLIISFQSDEDLQRIKEFFLK